MSTEEDTKDRKEIRAETKDVLVAAALVAGIIFLFVIDVTNPRGVVDGVGYPAVVALCIRFGRRTLYACTILTTFLIVIAAFLLPKAGISVEGEIANRVFAVASVWIVALLLSRRLSLEESVARFNAATLHRQQSYVEFVRDVLATNDTFEARARRVTEIATELLDVELVSIFRHFPKRSVARSVDSFRRSTKEHFTIPDTIGQAVANRDNTFREGIPIALDDLANSAISEPHRNLFEAQGLSALLAFGIFVDGELVGQMSFGHTDGPRHWSPQEVTSGLVVASLTASLFLSQRREETLKALDFTDEGIRIEDEFGDTSYANHAAGLSSASALPAPPDPLRSDRDLREVRSDGREFEIERVRLPNGGIISRLNDVTSRNASERERAQLQTRLQQSAKMEAIGQLAGGVAHDFNNILGSIMGFSGLLVQDFADGSAHKSYAQRIVTACQRGKELVDQILAFARARTIERGTADLERAVRQGEDMVRSGLPASISLELVLPEDPLTVEGSSVQLSQLIVNLCKNASDAIGKASGIVRIEVGTAGALEMRELMSSPLVAGEILAGEPDLGRPHARIRVSDDGAGIDDEILQRIFEPFFSTKGRNRGTGLGLAVVHGVVQSHRGLCHVQSAPGKGSVFTVYLPLAAEGEQDHGMVSAGPGDARGTERVLIVDDEADIVDMLSIGLNRLGYESVGVNDPVEALRAFEEDPDAFDVVITDHVMPGMRGLDLARKIKATRPETRIVLCSGYSEGVNSDLKAAVDAYVRKPTDAVAIAQTLRSLFRN